MVSALRDAKANNKCLEMKFPYPILPGYITFKAVNC